MSPPLMTGGRLDLRRVRHRGERLVFCASVLANMALIAGAVWAIQAGPQWLSSSPRVSALFARVQLVAVGVLLLLPVLGILRKARWATFCENAVRLGRDQVPAIYLLLERHCRTLGMDPPELYVSTDGAVGFSTAMALARGRRVIVLGPSLFSGLNRTEDRLDVFDFVLAHELGRLALGHAGWWEDLLLGYLTRIPLLRYPLLAVQAASRDRFAATLAASWTRGLAYTAAGGDMIERVDPAAIVRQVMKTAVPRHWAFLAKVGRKTPVFADRFRALYRAGFPVLDRDQDLRTEGGRTAGAPVPPTAR